MKKIMFNDKCGLTKAVLEGRKTMTRRPISERVFKKASEYRREYFNDTLDAISAEGALLEFSRLKGGDVVAVAQKYKDICHGLSDREASWFLDTLHLRYDDKCALDLPAWRNKEFVLADLMPHQIRITNVRVERLKDISDEDCQREGIYEVPFCEYSWEDNGVRFGTPRGAFAALIDKISGKGTWESNPWVFVYEFELVK